MELETETGRVLAAAVTVHRTLGPGFLERIYENALILEFEARGIAYERQVTLPISYRGVVVGEHRLDLLVEGRVVVELKAVLAVQDIFYATLRSYLRATEKPVGLLLNFAAATLLPKRVFPDLPPRP